MLALLAGKGAGEPSTDEEEAKAAAESFATDVLLSTAAATWLHCWMRPPFFFLPPPLPRPPLPPPLLALLPRLGLTVLA